MIKKICNCGEIYRFKDEFEGEVLYCPKCDREIVVKSDDEYFEIFNRSKFLIHQNHFAITEKYRVLGENGDELLYVERPRKIFKLFFSLLVAVVLTTVIGIPIGVLATAVVGSVSETAGVLSGLFIGFILIASFLFFTIIIYGKRHIKIFRDSSKRETVLSVEQENLFQFIKGKYKVLDHKNELLAKMEKNYISSFFRKSWKWKDENEKVVALIKEESVILAILRKLTGTLFGLLRVNFIFKNSNGGIFGNFNRKISIGDKYMLDLSPDKNKIYDRKVCVAIWILLDTGERR